VLQYAKQMYYEISNTSIEKPMDIPTETTQELASKTKSKVTKTFNEEYSHKLNQDKISKIKETLIQSCVTQQEIEEVNKADFNSINNMITGF